MSLGESTVEIESGGGVQRASAAVVARTVVQLGVRPLGDANEIIRASSRAAIKEALDVGALCEAGFFRHRTGLTTILVPINPSVAGKVSTVTQAGTGSGALAVSLAPHRGITVKCITGG